MKPSDFKRIVESLARFADTRAKPDDVKSKIGVQVDKSGNLTLIATSTLGGMLVRVGDGDDVAAVAGPYGYYIDAKTVLQAAKLVKGKMVLTFNVTPDRFEIIIAGGGRVACKAVGSLKEAGFLPKPKEFNASAMVPADKWEQVSKMEPAITKGEGYNVPTIELVEGVAYLVMTGGPSKHSYASLRLSGQGMSGTRAAVQHDMMEAFKALQADGHIEWGPSGLRAVSGDSECWSAPYKVSTWDSEAKVPSQPADPPAWPILDMQGVPTVSFSIDRMSFVETLRGLAASDEYGRFTMSIIDGVVTVTTFGSEDGFALPVKTSGKGARSASAEYMLRVVRGMTGKSITVGWMDDQPAIVLKSNEMQGWTILLAPIALS